MGVWVSPSGYGFLRREAGHWIEMETKPFITTDWKQGTRALVGQEGRQQLGFDSTGLPTDPLTVTLTREGERVSRSEEHTSELQSLMRISYAVFCLKKKQNNKTNSHKHTTTQN